MVLGSNAFFPLIVLFSPAALIVLASVSLFQFTQLFKGFVQVAGKRSGNAVWKFFQPYLKQIGVVVQSVLGPADKFTVNLTHVLLVALIIALVICTERIRSALLEQRIRSSR